MAEETLRMVVLERFQTIWTPDSSEAHLFPGEFSGPLHTVVLALSLQKHIQAHAEASHLISEELVARTRPLQFLFEHVHLTLYCSQIVVSLPTALPLPAEPQREEWSGLWIPGADHHSGLEASGAPLHNPHEVHVALLGQTSVTYMLCVRKFHIVLISSRYPAT